MVLQSRSCRWVPLPSVPVMLMTPDKLRASALFHLHGHPCQGCPCQAGVIHATRCPTHIREAIQILLSWCHEVQLRNVHSFVCHITTGSAAMLPRGAICTVGKLGKSQLKTNQYVGC